MNQKYDEFREGLGLKLINLTTDTLQMLALDDTYAFDETDSFGDLTGVLDTTTLTGKALSSAGVLTSDDIVFTGLAGGEDTAALVLYDLTATRLVAFYDLYDSGAVIALTGDGSSVPLEHGPDGWVQT